LRSLIERQRCEVGVRDQIAAQVELAAQARETRPVACAGGHDLCGRVQKRVEGRAVHDRRVKHWRHLDLGATRCVIE